jgi:hypothetical protein
MWSAFLDIHQGEATSEQNLTYTKRAVNTAVSRHYFGSQNIPLLRHRPFRPFYMIAFTFPRLNCRLLLTIFVQFLRVL